MASVGLSAGKRQSSAFAAKAAAKARRQKIIAGVLMVALVGVLAYESPTLLKVVQGTKAAAPPIQAAPLAPPATSDAKKQLRALRAAPAVDPFSNSVQASTDPGYRDVGIPPGSHDPFASGAEQTGSAPAVAVVPLPEKIVIGKPGGNRKARHGWIVILASIPTGNGQSSATKFASSARQNGLRSVAVLNSSNRRPLRGGYWVVYTGPFKTLNDVSAQASRVHSIGYATAYIRELIVYS